MIRRCKKCMARLYIKLSKGNITPEWKHEDVKESLEPNFTERRCAHQDDYIAIDKTYIQ